MFQIRDACLGRSRLLLLWAGDAEKMEKAFRTQTLESLPMAAEAKPS